MCARAGDKSVKLAAKAAKTSKHWEKVAHATVSVRSDHHRPVLHSPATQRKIAARPPTPDHTVGPSETFKQVIGGAHPDQPLLAGTAHVQNDLRFKDVEARVAYESWAATKLLEAKQRDQERRKKFEEKQASEKRVKEQKQQTAERTLAASKASQAEYRKQQAAAKAAFEADLAKTGAIIAERRRKSVRASPLRAQPPLSPPLSPPSTSGSSCPPLLLLLFQSCRCASAGRNPPAAALSAQLITWLCLCAMCHVHSNSPGRGCGRRRSSTSGSKPRRLMPKPKSRPSIRAAKAQSASSQGPGRGQRRPNTAPSPPPSSRP